MAKKKRPRAEEEIAYKKFLAQMRARYGKSNNELFFYMTPLEVKEYLELLNAKKEAKRIRRAKTDVSITRVGWTVKGRDTTI